MKGTDPQAKRPSRNPVLPPFRSRSHLPTMLTQVAYTKPAPPPPKNPKPRYASRTCGAYASDTYPRSAPAAPSIIGERADSLPFSRSRPTANATAAGRAHTPSSQKMWAPCQSCASESVSSAEVNAYSYELMAIIAIHGGLIRCSSSHPKPMCSIAPGPKFSARMSNRGSRSAIRLPLCGLHVQRDAPLVAVEHREVEAVDIGDVT